MTSKNDITGDKLITKPSTNYASGWDAIWGKKLSKRKIVVHQLRATLEAAEGYKLTGSMTIHEKDAEIDAFVLDTEGVINVPAAMCTGWRVPFYDDEVDIEFVGNVTAEQAAQFKGRCMPASMRPKK